MSAYYSRLLHSRSKSSTFYPVLQGVNGIVYLGKGTYIDCALTNMTQEMLRAPSSPEALRFAVVITDGHVTGNPCGGIKVAAEGARDKGIKMFVVAASRNVDETGLKEIANSPADVYRRDFMAVDLSQGRALIHTATIDRIIKTMVTHYCKLTRKCFTCVSDASNTLFLFCLCSNTWHTSR